MRKPEKQLYNKLKREMNNIWDMQSHEDKYSVGVPDVSYGLEGMNGWIELKRVLKYPKKSQTVIQLPHFTGQQRNWLERRQEKGGNCWLLLQVEDDYFIFKGDRCDRVGNCYNKEGLMRNAYSVYLCNIKTIGMWLYEILIGRGE